jgi:putative ABC transport system ATP-binding protein
MSNLIEIKNLVKTYDSGEVQVQALKGVNLLIPKGDFVAIMGASGSGKSTLMNILGCLDIPTSGDYILDGVEVKTMNRNELAEFRNKKLGFVFQSFNLLTRTSVLDNVMLPLLYNKTIPESERAERCHKAIDMLGLTSRAKHYSNQLSGGQQQRVAIARSLVGNPLVILADEPTGNLDTATSNEVMAIFQDLNEKGITIVLVTHEPDIAAFAKRKVVFKDGHIISDEKTNELKTNN